jgi:hypothetical protein
MVLDPSRLATSVRRSDAKAAAERLDFLGYIVDHFTECADEHLRNGEHDMRRECTELAAIAARRWLEINHQSTIQRAVRI